MDNELSEIFTKTASQAARVFKSGNSLAIRVPSGIAKAMEIEDGSPVEMAVSNGLILIRRGASRNLNELLERISPQNLHGEEVSDLVGNERW